MEFFFNPLTYSLGAAILVIFYLIGAGVYYIQMAKINHRVGKRKHKVDVLAAQKYDVLRMIGKLFVFHHIDVPQELILSKRPRFEDTLQNIKHTERTIVHSFLVRTAQSLFYYGEQNQSLAANPEYITLKKTLAEIDENFQKGILEYNADAMGFNYWRRFFLYRWISFLMALKHRELMA